MYSTYKHKLSKIPKQIFYQMKTYKEFNKLTVDLEPKIEINDLQIKIRPIENNKIKLIIG